eukprot:8775708-Pyramimonas_sp.AAC.1
MARASRIEGGWFSTCGSRLSAAHIRFKLLREFHGLKAVPFQNAALASAPCAFVLGIYKDYPGATVMLLLCVGIPEMAFWRESKSSGRSSQVDTWRENLENIVLVGFKVFERFVSSEAVPSMERNRCRGL